MQEQQYGAAADIGVKNAMVVMEVVLALGVVFGNIFEGFDGSRFMVAGDRLSAVRSVAYGSLSDRNALAGEAVRSFSDAAHLGELSDEEIEDLFLQVSKIFSSIRLTALPGAQHRKAI